MNKNFNHITKLLLIAVILVIVAGMFLPFTGDAGKYAAISKTIYKTREFWDLMIHRSPYFQKPPVMMWLSAAGYLLTGTVNNFTTHLFPVLSTLLMLLATYKLGKHFYSKNTGIYAALFTGTTQIFFLYNSDLHTDSLLASFTTAAIWQLAIYIDNQKWKYFFGGFIFTGLAMLTKGPIGLAIPVFAIGVHLLATRKYRMIFNPAWLLGAVILGLMIFPHLRILYQYFGWEGPKFYFWTNNAGRISGTYRGSNTDHFFYIHNLAVFALPWSIFFFGGIIKNLKEFFIKKQKTELLTVGGSLLFIFILSFAKMKSPNYFYPAIPLLAIPAALFFLNLIETNKIKKYLVAQTFICCLMIIVLLVVITWMFPLRNPAIWMAIVVLISLMIFTWIKEKNAGLKIINSSLAAIVIMNLGINLHVLPELFSYQASLRASEIYNEKAIEGEHLYTYRYAQFEMFFYAKTDGDKIIDNDTHYDPVTIELSDALNDKGAWFFTDEYGYHEIKSKIGIENEYAFDHYYLTDINWKFLNPQTRNASLKKMYLLKTLKE